ncbi:hypothetical protein NOK90_22735 [Vibrio parahaemolyticus]|uniref:hypothetical protein n=1 Tax=Vibrio parahaemolyticus TaxID=670 RepID=UPI00226B5478|nr:hypothetical protein [Vibrio parahaemolyticus]MCX8793587.1 hypothetical protein [Vibrio parahaemolyticus]
MRKDNLYTFDSWPVGTPERLIHGYWELGVMRFHTFDSECGKELQDTYNRINHGLGANVVYIDLTSMGDGYRYKSEILDVIRSDQQTWVWFVGCRALLESSLAGWLRSVLTTYNLDHVRVAFVLDSREQFNYIFQDYSAPFYQSTIALDLSKNS